MSYFSSCAGLEIIGGSLLIPLVGAWTADLTLSGAQPVAGKVPIVIGNLTLQGAVYRTDVYGGQVHVRVVGGAGGWRTAAPAQGYGSTTGVMLSTVLGDVAAAVGETVNTVADTSLGYAFARIATSTSVASDVLWQLISQGFMPAWYVDPNGVTQAGAWPSTTVATPFIPTDQKPAEGIVTVATEDYASWLPGCSFSHPLLAQTLTSAGVHYTWGSSGEFRLEVLTGDTTDRVLGPLQQIVQKEIAPARYFGRYEYTIASPTPTTIDGSPCDTTLGLPELQAVPLVGDALASYTPPDGGKAHIQFLDGHATKPVCVWTEASANNGPTEVTLCPQGDGANAVARVSDTVVVMFPPVMQIAGTVAGAPFIGVLAITTPGIGTIQTGSSLVKATT